MLSLRINYNCKTKWHIKINFQYANLLTCINKNLNGLCVQYCAHITMIDCSNKIHVGESHGLVVKADGSRSRGCGFNSGTIYWMSVSNASYYIHEYIKNKSSQMGHNKKIFNKITYHNQFSIYQFAYLH
jgi:hypothetical protein